MSVKKTRNSSFELLRILSMFAIVIHHFALKSTLDGSFYSLKYANALKINLFFHYLGKLGVVIFVMIGAYFLCNKKFNFRRPISLTVITAFYSFAIYLIIKATLPEFVWGNDTLTRILLPFPLPS